MNICIYNGAKRMVEKSGVGRAMEHQKRILELCDCTVTKRIEFETSIVHINTVFPDSVLAAIFAKIMRKQVIYYGHSTMEDFRNSFVGSNHCSFLFQKWIRFCYGLGDVIITPTEYSKRLLVDYGIKKPIYAVSNGIDCDFYTRSQNMPSSFRTKYKIASNKKVIMSVGHFIERKGILEYIELAKRHPDFVFFWFGYTNPKLISKKIKKAIANAPNNLFFPGYIKREELLAAYHECDLFCFMSHEETEGIVVLEALASKIPVLVRNIPVYDGWLVDKENAYKADSDADFDMKMLGILDGSLSDLTEQGARVAEARSFHKIAKKLLEIEYSLYNDSIFDAKRSCNNENISC